MVDDESGSERECLEHPGNSVSGVVGSCLGSGAASASRDTGSSSTFCT